MTDTAADPANLPDTGQFYHARELRARCPTSSPSTTCRCKGAIPPELDGWYLRNGPNPRQPTGHWFVGDGMIHGVRIEGGAAKWYRNRWVRTDSFEHPIPLYNGDGTRNLRSAVANTHIVNHAGKTLALVESSLPYQITKDLETVGCYDFDGKLNDAMTAHPKICPDHGRVALLRLRQLCSAARQLSPRGRRRRLTVSRPVEVQALTMMHDFAMTAEHVIFMDLPIVFNIDIAVNGKRRHALPLGGRLRRPVGGAAPRRPVRRGALVRYRSVLHVPRRQRL